MHCCRKNIVKVYKPGQLGMFIAKNMETVFGWVDGLCGKIIREQWEQCNTLQPFGRTLKFQDFKKLFLKNIVRTDQDYMLKVRVVKTINTLLNPFMTSGTYKSHWSRKG
jgi:hypothetical protein